MKIAMNSASQWRPPTLKSNRLVLRALGERDAEAVFNYAKNSAVSRYTLWEPHQSIKDSEAFISEYAFTNYSNSVPEPWAITFDGKVIGTTGCFWVSKNHHSMELAYALSEEHWGKDLVAEASREVMNWVFREIQPQRIQARCKTENKASARVMEKLGMQFEGTHRSETFHRNQYWDMHYYSILKGDWSFS